jgi:hypothetical protein
MAPSERLQNLAYPIALLIAFGQPIQEPNEWQCILIRAIGRVFVKGHEDFFALIHACRHWRQNTAAPT